MGLLLPFLLYSLAILNAKFAGFVPFLVCKKMVCLCSIRAFDWPMVERSNAASYLQLNRDEKWYYLQCDYLLQTT